MKMCRLSASLFTTVAFAASLVFASAPVCAQESLSATDKPAFSVEGKTFPTWNSYFTSQYFKDTGRRCGTQPPSIPRVIDPSDCSFTSTNPSNDYLPGDIYEIPVVVHIIEHTNGDGQITDGQVQTQIDILNEDFRALAGTPGAGGYDTGIQFVLASTDPGGSPTTGITRDVNNTWHNDSGSFWNSLAWDTAEYLNLYTNDAGGFLG